MILLHFLLIIFAPFYPRCELWVLIQTTTATANSTSIQTVTLEFQIHFLLRYTEWCCKAILLANECTNNYRYRYAAFGCVVQVNKTHAYHQNFEKSFYANRNGTSSKKNKVAEMLLSEFP